MSSLTADGSLLILQLEQELDVLDDKLLWLHDDEDGNELELEALTELQLELDDEYPCIRTWLALDTTL